MEKLGICEVDNINEIIKKDRFKLINNKLKQKGFKKVALNLSPIDDDEYIAIEYDNGSFKYKLPFTINIENTKKQFENEKFIDLEDRIDSEKTTIFEDGLIIGRGFKIMMMHYLILWKYCQN